MAEPVASVRRVRDVLDAELEKVGATALRSAGEVASYCSQPFGDVLFLLSLTVDARSETISGGSYLVEPLPVPLRMRLLVERFRAPRSGLVRRRSAWPIADLNVLAPQIAQIAAAGLSELRDRFDGAARFALEVDYEYLADDWLELAEAVAYMWYIGGDTRGRLRG